LPGLPRSRNAVRVVWPKPLAKPIQLVPTPGTSSGPAKVADSEESGEVEKKTPLADPHEGLRSFKNILIGGGFGLMLTIGYFLHFATVINPDISYRTAFWMMAGSAFDNGVFIIFLLIVGLIYLGILIIPFTMRDIENAKKTAAEIKDAAESEAKEEKDKAEKEAGEILRTAQKEAEKIRQIAEKEAQKIIASARELKAQAQQKGRKICEGADADLMEAQAEVSEILDRARDEAKLILSREKAQCKDLWDWCHFKAKEAGVTPEEWIGIKKLRKEAQEVLDSARKEAEAIMGGTCGQAEACMDSFEERKSKEILLVNNSDNGNQRMIGSSSSEAGIENQGSEESSANRVAAIEDKILAILSDSAEIRKRDLERKAHKDRYDRSLWELAMENLLGSNRIVYDQERGVFRKSG